MPQLHRAGSAGGEGVEAGEVGQALIESLAGEAPAVKTGGPGGAWMEKSSGETAAFYRSFR